MKTATQNNMGMMQMPMMMPMMNGMNMMMPMMCTMSYEMTKDGMVCTMKPMKGMDEKMFKEACERMCKMMEAGCPTMMSCGGMNMMCCCEAC